MRILQLASGDLWAGAEVQLYHLACELNKSQKIELKVVLLNHGQLELMLKEQEISVVVLDETKLSTFQIIHELEKICKGNEIDLIHSHRLKENIVGGIVAKKVNCKSIRTVHGATETPTSLLDLKHRLLSLMDKYTAIFLQQKIVAVSSELNKSLLKTYSEQKITTINNSVNIDYIANRSGEFINIPINERSINIGFIGRFVQVKRVHLFVDIAKSVIRENPDSDIHFHMIGDGPLFANIQDQITGYGLNQNIHLLGFVENSAPYLKKLDFLMFTSEHEGLPMTLLEAMSLSVPVISVELPSIRKILKGEECGYFIDADNIVGSSKKISEIVKDPKRAMTKAKRAFEIVKNEYSINSNVSKFTKLYEEVLQEIDV